MTKATSKKTAKPVKQSKTARAESTPPGGQEPAPVDTQTEAPAVAPAPIPDGLAAAALQDPAPQQPAPEATAVQAVQATQPPQHQPDAPQATPQAPPQATPEAAVHPNPGPYPDPTMTAATPQYQVPHVDPPSVEPDTTAQTSVVNQAMDVIAASDSQQNSIRRAFELQRATIAHGVKERRDAATQEMAATKAAYEQQKGNYPMNQQQGQMGYGAAPQGQPGMPGQQLSTNQILAQEFADTIRGMIAQEVDRQLKALLSTYTATQNAQAQEQAVQPQQPQPQPQAPQAPVA